MWTVLDRDKGCGKCAHYARSRDAVPTYLSIADSLSSLPTGERYLMASRKIVRERGFIVTRWHAIESCFGPKILLGYNIDVETSPTSKSQIQTKIQTSNSHKLPRFTEQIYL